MESRVHADAFEDILKLAMEGCQSIHSILDKVLFSFFLFAIFFFSDSFVHRLSKIKQKRESLLEGCK